MIGYLSGTIQTVSDKYVIIDVNGVGYRVVIPEKNRLTLSELGQKVNIYTHFVMNPRDGSTDLYGFESPEELKFFELMMTVSGIGPKSAQGILSSVDLQTLQLGIIKGDHDYLAKTAGIGPKTAQRLILELKSKVFVSDLGEHSTRDIASEGEAVDALVALGYSNHQAREALKGVDVKLTRAEDKISQALKILGKK